jgi:uncharacterized protein YndB with AHSA1/START domain
MSTDRIEKQIVLKSPVSRVWRALADSREFGTWFGVRFDGPFQPGAHMRGKMTPTAVDPAVGKAQKPYEGWPFEITIERMEPEKLFSFRWHPYAIERGVDYSGEPTTLVSFVLEPVAEGVKLTVTESGFDQIPLERRAKAFTANEEGWGMMIQVVGKYLAGAR